METFPLESIKVLDFSRLIAGPYCTMLLGDMGADVIKVEQPGKGDDSRAFGPPFINGESVYFFSFNRNKKSITVNLKTEKGKEIIKELIKKADVLVENFRPGYMEKIGLSYEEVKKLNHRIIYTSVSGYGQTGPYMSRPGYDVVIQGLSGFMSLTGDPEGSPYKVGTSIADLMAAIYAFQGILLALIAREKTGKGQRIDISLLDGLVSLLTYQAGIYFATDNPPLRKGNQHPTICPYETFKASDEYINIAVGNDKFWYIFCDLIGLEHIKHDPKFAINPERVKHRDELFSIIQNILSQKKAEEWLTLFKDHGIPSGPVLTLDKVLTHPQILARDMVVNIEHPACGNIKLTGIPVKLSDTPGSIKLPPPLLGEHNEEVLSSILNYDKQEIKKLAEEGIL
ncbi:MAG: CoA transferase [Candidatus Eremiobacterota bacterium]